MIQIEQIKEIPELEWAAQSAKEYEKYFEQTIKQNADIYLVKDEVPLFVVGLIYRSMINPPWMWLLLTQDYIRRLKKSIRATRLAIEYLPRGTMTAVAHGFRAGDTFARAFDFQPVGEWVVVEGKKYDIYRRN